MLNFFNKKKLTNYDGLRDFLFFVVSFIVHVTGQYAQRFAEYISCHSFTATRGSDEHNAMSYEHLIVQLIYLNVKHS